MSIILSGLLADMTQLDLRHVEQADVPQIAAIRASQSGSEDFWKHRIASYLRGEHSPQKALPARAAFVAAEEGQIVGFVAGHRTTRFKCDGELQWIDVVEYRRGRGIADRLIAYMGAWFLQYGPTRICVNVAPQNTRAGRVYARSGAVPLNEFWMIWEDASSGPTGERS